MLSRPAEAVVRIVLGVLGIVGIGLAFVVLDGSSDLSAEQRVLLATPCAALFAYGLSAASELKDKYHNRDLMRFGRFGKRRVILSQIEGSPVTEYGLPSVYPTAEPLRLAVRPRGTLIAFGFGALLGIVAWRGTVSAANRDELSESGLLLIVLLPIALWLAIRALIRLALGHRAVRLDAAAITLGISLGFAWPVRIPFAEIARIVTFARDAGPQILIETTDDRSYHVDGRRLQTPDSFTAWFAANTTSGSQVESVVEPIPDIELPRPIIGAGTGAPDPQRVERLRVTLQRRTWATTAILLIAALVAAAGLKVFIDLRLENDHLDRSGTIYAAEVFDTNRSSRGPDELSVRFVANGVTYERTITSGWFSGFRRGLKGETIPVLFDPGQEGIARLPSDRNYPLWIKLWVSIAMLLLLFAALYARADRWHHKACELGRWERAQILAGSAKQRQIFIRRHQDEETHVAQIMRKGTTPTGEQEGWIASCTRGLVILFDDGDRWSTAVVGKRSPLRSPAGA